MAGQPKGYVPAFDDHDTAAAFRQVFETGKVTGTKKKNDGDKNASGRTKESSNNTKYPTLMARARQERRKEEIQKDGSDSSSSPESTNTNNNNNNKFFVAGGVGILSKSSSLDAPIMNGGSLDKLESSSTPSSGEGASVHSDKSERSEKSAMYQARAAKATRARESSVSAATTMGEEDGGGGEGEGEGGGTGAPSKAGRFNRRLKDASGDGAGHLPKFGDWNSKPPTASGPGYTVMFKAASKERRAGVGVPPPRLGSGSPPRTGDLYKLVPGRRPKKPNKLLCCIISTAIE